MRSPIFAISCLLSLFLIGLNPAPRPAEALEPEAFGQGVLTVNGELPRGTRHLLVVLMDFDDVQFDVDHTRALYEGLFNGPGFPNVSDYYSEQSGGRFTWQSRVVGPVTHPDDPRTDENEGLINCATFRTLPGPDGDMNTGDDVGGCPSHPSATDRYYNRTWRSILTTTIEEAALRAGVDFSTYDRDDDGTVKPDELVVVLIGAEPVGGRFRESGATRAAAPNRCVDVPDQDVEVCTSFPTARGRSGAMGSFGEAVDFDTLVHELAHTLGALDLYGARSRMNQNLTVMGPTVGGPEDERRTYHLDPWHRMALGWISPVILEIPEITQENACRTLTGVRGELAIEDRARRPLLLYDPANDPREFYMIEGRNPEGYDENVAGGMPGAALWYVQLASDRLPRRFDSLIQPGRNGTLDSPRRGDDFRTPSGSFIRPGPDGRLQTTASLDDTTADDVMLFHLGSSTTADPTLYGIRGTPGLWTPASGVADPSWFGGASSGLSMRVIQIPSVAPWSISVDLAAREIAFAPLRGTPTAMSGERLTMSGHFGSPVSRTVTVSPMDGGSADELWLNSWSCRNIEATLPRLAAGRYELRVRDSALGISSDPRIISIGSVAAGAEPADWEGVYAGRLDGRRARLTIERGGHDIPTWVIELEDLQRGGVFSGSATLRTGAEWHVYEDIRLQKRDGERSRTLGALYLDTRDGAHVTGWSQDDFAFAFREGGISAPGGGRLQGRKPEAWQRQWQGVYLGEFDGEEVELTVSPDETSALGATFTVELRYLAPDRTFTGTGSVLSNAARKMRFGRPLRAEEGRDTVRLTKLLIHTWDTSYISGFGSDLGERFVGGYFAASPD